MSYQVALPSDVEEMVKSQAEAEHRRVRQQIEFIVIKAIREMEKADRAISKEEAHAR
jgi:hypothetical protein